MAQRCLIVDDSPAFLSSARALLESQGMTVTACALSGEEPLAIAKQTKPDLALVDVELAGEDGFMLARSLIAQDPALYVVSASTRSRRCWTPVRRAWCGRSLGRKQ